MSHLGNFYAEKILGAADLALFDKTGQRAHQDASVRHLEAALLHWKQYVTMATRQYRPQLLTRVAYVDLNALTKKVEEDVAIAKEWQARQP